MIDFRYHIVSIVSIFLALAVGIVLGAGPLQQELGRTLQQQVTSLRKDKSDLRSQLDEAQQRVDAGDSFAEAVTPQLVGSQLGGRSVVVVRLPGSDGGDVGAVTKTLRAAGATVNGQVSVQQAWSDPGKRAFRESLLTNLDPVVGLDGSPSDDLEVRMGRLLARALVVDQVSDADQQDADATQALAGLKDAGLLSYSGTGPPPSTLAVVVAPTASSLTGTDDERTATLTAWSGIATALDAASNGGVVVGAAGAADSGGLVAAVRGSGTAKRTVSTVDDADTPMGRVAVVLALRQQMGGGAGQYGTAAGASAVLPDLGGAS